MKKLSNQLKADLKSLKQIKPDSAWLEQNRLALLNQLQISATPTQTLSRLAQISSYTKDFLSRLAWQPVGGLLLLAGLVVGPSIAAVNAAKGSLPGDALYPVKRSLERAQLTFTLSSTSRAQLEVDLVATRLHELQRITKEQAPSPERQQNIAIALEELNKDTATVKTHLETVKNTIDDSSKQQAVELAKIVDQKTTDYQQSLRAAVADLDPETAKTSSGNIGQAISSVQDVSINALDILVNKANDGDQLTPDDVQTRVQNQLDSLKKTTDGFKAQVALLIPAPATTVVAPATPASPAATTTPSVPATPANVPQAPVTTTPATAPVPTTPATPTTGTSNQATPSTPATTDTTPATPAPATDTPLTTDQQAATDPSVTPTPTTTPTANDLESRLESDVLPLIAYAEQLIKVQDFSGALDTINKANKIMADLSKGLSALQGDQTPTPDPSAAAPATDSSGAPSTTGSSSSSAPATTDTTSPQTSSSTPAATTPTTQAPTTTGSKPKADDVPATTPTTSSTPTTPAPSSATTPSKK